MYCFKLKKLASRGGSGAGIAESGWSFTARAQSFPQTFICEGLSHCVLTPANSFTVDRLGQSLDLETEVLVLKWMTTDPL